MGNYAIQARGLGKMYRIGAAQRVSYRTLRETMMTGFSAPFRRATQLLRGGAYGVAGLSRELWALRDVSFAVQHGEAVGIIGRNGAGKSTLLKVLSRITKPTEGCADVYGRMGTMLEVSVGFHPELTGRENIYLNGAILGMRRREIDRKFDEIVDFAGVDKFIDTPVKHFSSGMALRLGFAVAAHLEPEILVVDEVLAVGDLEFQKKCLSKMSSVAVEGRTVLFVSHDMGAIANLCQRAILLDKGQIVRQGATADVLSAYLVFAQMSPMGDVSDLPRGGGVVSAEVRLARCQFLNSYDEVTEILKFGEPIKIRLTINAQIPKDELNIILRVDSAFGVHLATVRSADYNVLYSVDPKDPLVVTTQWNDVFLEPGGYMLTLAIRDGQGNLLDALMSLISFTISKVPYGPQTPPSAKQGVIALNTVWG